MGARAVDSKGCASAPWRGRAARALLAIAAVAPGPAMASDYEDMVAAERAFAADAAARTTREAFIAALADDAIMFAPAPVPGKALWQGRAPNGNRLEWAPALAEIAASGDLGYTAGPWRFTPEKGDKPVAHGWFFTIWKKQADGAWKVLVDHGIDTAETAFPDTVLRRGGLSVGAPPGWPVGVPELRSADLVPAGELHPRLVSADFLRLRTGKAPDNRAEGLALPSTATRVDTGLAISGAGDLAATWGGGAGSPAWIRVWRRPTAEDAPGAGWKLAVDFALPAAPPPEPEPPTAPTSPAPPSPLPAG
jgi:ketosteroid isomerase-like protein